MEEISFEDLVKVSNFEVKIEKIEEIIKAPNSDFLFSCRVLGWWVVVSGKKNENGELIPPYNVGDLVILLPIDSIINKKLEDFLFPLGSKIVLTNSRIKTIKIRQVISQGMIIGLTPELLNLFPELKGKKLGDEVSKILGITKYEPPIKLLPSGMRTKPTTFKNPYFKEYTDLNHLKKYPDVISEGVRVVLTEKIHGCCSRYSILPKTANIWWKKLLQRLGLLKGFEQCIGSRIVQKHLQPKYKRGGFYGEDVWTKAENKYKLLEKLKPMEILFGEVYGPGIQKGYHYGVNQNDIGFVAFDLMKDGVYVDYDEFVRVCEERNIPRVPELYRGPYSAILLDTFVNGPSVLCDKQKIREGIVVKPIKETYHPSCGRIVLKYLNPDYLLQKDNTEWH